MPPHVAKTMPEKKKKLTKKQIKQNCMDDLNTAIDHTNEIEENCQRLFKLANSAYLMGAIGMHKELIQVKKEIESCTLIIREIAMESQKFIRRAK
jgi:hypothetical protein